MIVFAPVMPSLKSLVICEFSSRISRFTATSRFWKMVNSTTSTGRIITTISASFALIRNMTSTAPTR